jgi:hypothetical protein
MQYLLVAAGLVVAMIVPGAMFFMIQTSSAEHLLAVSVSLLVYLLFCVVRHYCGLVAAGKASIGVISVLWVASGMYSSLGIVVLLTNYLAISLYYFLFDYSARNRRSSC